MKSRWNNIHKWKTSWDDNEDSCIDVCINCGLKRMLHHSYAKGTTIVKGKIHKYLIDNEWQVVLVPECKK